MYICNTAVPGSNDPCHKRPHGFKTCFSFVDLFSVL